MSIYSEVPYVYTLNFMNHRNYRYKEQLEKYLDNNAIFTGTRKDINFYIRKLKKNNLYLHFISLLSELDSFDKYIIYGDYKHMMVRLILDGFNFTEDDINITHQLMNTRYYSLYDDIIRKNYMNKTRKKKNVQNVLTKYINIDISGLIVEYTLL